jgi:hypothetical protein
MLIRRRRVGKKTRKRVTRGGYQYNTRKLRRSKTPRSKTPRRYHHTR